MKNLILLSLLVTALPLMAIADTLLISDLEGSISKLETLVKNGKLKWIQTPKGPRLDFVNSDDVMVFLGDLSGPNWMDSSNPQNMHLQDIFLDLKNRHPARFDYIWGNHEANRFGFIRENILMSKGKHTNYSEWLKGKDLKDTVENRVTFWGTKTYGVNKEGVPLPVADYQKELSHLKNKSISVKEAAEQFAADLKVGKDGKPHGKMLELLLKGQESSYRSGYTLTHAPIITDASGIIPMEAKKHAGGASWLRERNIRYFTNQLNIFISMAQKDEVPPPFISDIGDARWDSTAKRVVNDSSSITYTERGKVSGQYVGVDPAVATKFATDPELPSRGLISGHKPAGNYATVHRQEINGKPFFDVVVDTSRGPVGNNSIVVIKDNGDLEISGTTNSGKTERWIVNQSSDPLIGKRTEDGFHIKGETSDGKYILERYAGYDLEEKIVLKSEIDPLKTSFSFDNPKLNEVTNAKVQALEKAVKAHGGQVFASTEDAVRIVGDRFVLDLRGASKWAAVDEDKAALIRKQLTELAARLEPRKVVIMTGGNRAGHVNAVENMVHDIFAGPGVKKKFDIIGFMKYDTPADEVDKAVKYILLNGEGDNWDGPVQAAQKFVEERRGASVVWGGGGVLERVTETPIAAKMKDRLIMMQGFGGASEKNVLNGVAASTAEDIFEHLSKADKNLLMSGPIAKKEMKVGVYTGSFDPPHKGHKKIVEEMKKRYNLDIVYVVPDHSTAYKPDMLPYEHRKTMVQLMFENDLSIQTLTPPMEAKLAKSGEMWDVLRVVTEEGPGAQHFNLMGTDTFEWYKTLDESKRDKKVIVLVNQRDSKVKVPTTLNEQKVQVVDLGDEGISSTKIRNELKTGATSSALDPKVSEYIKDKNLYSFPTLSPDEIGTFFKKKGKKVVTFIGYSAAGYEDMEQMRAHARKTLQSLDPKKVIINIGATSDGIGDVYSLAKEMGFETTGIVSSKAKAYGGLSPNVDKAFYVIDETWGGYMAGTETLSPTSKAMVENSDLIVAIGGGDVGADEIKAAEKMGKKVIFHAADMNHAKAIAKAQKAGKEAPTNFRGPAYEKRFGLKGVPSNLCILQLRNEALLNQLD